MKIRVTVEINDKETVILETEKPTRSMLKLWSKKLIKELLNRLTDGNLPDERNDYAYTGTMGN